MKKRILIVIAILVLILALFVGCKITSAVDHVKNLNGAFEKISNITSGSYSIIASSEGREIYTENTTYTVSDESVSYECNIKKPDPDMWSEKDYVEQKAEGIMTKDELFGIFYGGLELSKDSIDGEIAVVENDGSIEYTFKLLDSTMVDVKPSNIEGGTSVVITVIEGTIREMTVEYGFEGYEIVKKYQIEY